MENAKIRPLVSFSSCYNWYQCFDNFEYYRDQRSIVNCFNHEMLPFLLNLDDTRRYINHCLLK